MRSKSGILLRNSLQISSLFHFNGGSSSSKLLHLSPLFIFNFNPPFYFPSFLFSFRYYASHHLHHDVDDPELFLKFVRKQSKLGFTNVEIPLSHFHHMISMRPLPSIIDFCMLLSAMSKIKPHPPFSTVISLSRHLHFLGLCRSGDNAGALTLLRNMESYGHFMPNVVIYSTIIDSLCKDQLLPQALRLFKEMKVKGISPNVVTYTTLIRGMCTLGHQKEAQQMLTEMLRNYITPDIETYNMLIDMYCKDGKVGQVRDIFEYMTKIGLVPNIITYSALLDGYCLRGEMGEAEKLMDLMVENGCKPGVVTYNSLINGYCKSKKIDKALGLLQEMHFNGLAPNVITYTTLIDALCKVNQLKLAHQFFKEMEAHGLKPNVITWNSLLDGMCKNGQIDEAITIVKQMENTGVVPDIVTYSILMDGLCDAKRLREAVDIFSVLTTKGLHDVCAYTIMIKGFCKEGLLVKADELLKNMEDNGCFPNDCTFNTIIRGFIDGKDVRRALELVTLMRNKEFVADNHTISSFVSLLSDPNIGDEDRELLKKFLEN